jgi:hypothetical protein
MRYPLRFRVIKKWGNAKKGQGRRTGYNLTHERDILVLVGAEGWCVRDRNGKPGAPDWHELIWKKGFGARTWNG